MYSDEVPLFLKMVAAISGFSLGLVLWAAGVISGLVFLLIVVLAIGLFVEAIAKVLRS